MVYKQCEHSGRQLGRHQDLIACVGTSNTDYVLWRPSVKCRVKHIEALFHVATQKQIGIQKNAVSVIAEANTGTAAGIRVLAAIDEEFDVTDYMRVTTGSGAVPFTLVVQWEPSTEG